MWKRDGESNSIRLGDLDESISHLEYLMKVRFERDCETGFYLLNFHLLDDLVDNLEVRKLRTPIMNVSPFEI